MSYYRRRRSKPKPKPTTFNDNTIYARHFYELSKTRAHYQWDFGRHPASFRLAGPMYEGGIDNVFKSVLISDEDRATFAGILTNLDYAVIVHREQDGVVDCASYGRADYEQKVKSFDTDVWKAKHDSIAKDIAKTNEDLGFFGGAIAAALVAVFFLLVGIANESWGDLLVAVSMFLIAVAIVWSEVLSLREKKMRRMELEQLLEKHSKTPLPRRSFPEAQARNQLTVFELNRLTPKEFEQHVAQIYRKIGFETHLTKHTDQGVDVIAERGAQRIAIQCKRYGGSVGNDAIQAVFTGAMLYKCNETMVITTSSFTAEAKRIAKTTGTRLIDGSAYQNIVRKAIAGQKESAG